MTMVLEANESHSQVLTDFSRENMPEGTIAPFTADPTLFEKLFDKTEIPPETREVTSVRFVNRTLSLLGTVIGYYERGHQTKTIEHRALGHTFKQAWDRLRGRREDPVVAEQHITKAHRIDVSVSPISKKHTVNTLLREVSHLSDAVHNRGLTEEQEKAHRLKHIAAGIGAGALIASAGILLPGSLFAFSFGKLATLTLDGYFAGNIAAYYRNPDEKRARAFAKNPENVAAFKDIIAYKRVCRLGNFARRMSERTRAKVITATAPGDPNMPLPVPVAAANA